MEKTDKFSRTFTKFEKAFFKYKEIIKSEELFDFLNQELIIEVATKRFEYVFESLWKTLKEYFKKEGVDCSTPLRCFKEAFKAGLIEQKHENVFMEMIEKRNLIVHVYDFEMAKDIYEFIKSHPTFSAIQSIYTKIQNNK